MIRIKLSDLKKILREEFQRYFEARRRHKIGLRSRDKRSRADEFALRRRNEARRLERRRH